MSFSSFSYTIEYMKMGNNKLKASGYRLAPIRFNSFVTYSFAMTTTG